MVTTSALAKLKKAIMDEVSSLETVMRVLYSRFGTMPKAFVHLNN